MGGGVGHGRIIERALFAVNSKGKWEAADTWALLCLRFHLEC